MPKTLQTKLFHFLEQLNGVEYNGITIRYGIQIEVIICVDNGFILLRVSVQFSITCCVFH